MNTNQVEFTGELTKEFFDELRQSVFGLVKYNDGIYKSEKQRNYVKPRLDRVKGVVGYDDGTNYSVYYYVDYDDIGIKKIKYYSKKSKEDIIKFERKDDDSFSKDLQDINQKKVESLVNNIEEIKVRAFQNENQIGYLKEIKKTHPHVKSSIDIAIKSLQESIDNDNKEIEQLTSKMIDNIPVYKK
jgi:hypothetical protein